MSKVKFNLREDLLTLPQSRDVIGVMAFIPIYPIASTTAAKPWYQGSEITFQVADPDSCFPERRFGDDEQTARKY
jgi:hypothetical protein